MGVDLLELYNYLLRHYGNQSWWPADTRFEVAVGAILTQNTSWTNVERAIERLRESEMLVPEKLINKPTEEVGQLIVSAGFKNSKSRAIKEIARFFAEGPDHMKNTTVIRSELLNIKGIGNETADAILLYALDRPVFVVDKYTRRLLTRLGINPPSGYRALQKFLEDKLPKRTELYKEYHALIVRHNKSFCRSSPSCSDCCLEQICLQNI